MQRLSPELLTRNRAERPRSEQLLLAVTDCVELLARSARWQDVLAPALARLGQAAGVGRVYAHRLFREADSGHLVVHRVQEWLGDQHGITPTHPLQVRIDLTATLPEVLPWLAANARGEATVITSEELPQSVQAAYRELRIESLLTVPVMLGEGVWWGNVGFADAQRCRLWEEHEIQVLQSFADMLAAAMLREAG